jgi:cholesterol transport system auxiliary component
LKFIGVSRRLLSLSAALSCAAVLSGCGGGLFSASAPPTFDLAAVTAFPRHNPAARGQLVVVEPTALALLDSERIVVRSGASEVSYVPGAQWSDKLPRLLQARVVQSFENAHRLRAVGRQGDRLAATYQLLLDIRTFQISVADNAQAEVEITAKILGDRSGRILAARVFRTTAPAAGADGPNAVAALNAALAKLVTELVVWAEQLV